MSDLGRLVLVVVPAALLTLGACDCERRQAEERLVALEAMAEAQLSHIELADLGPGHIVAPLNTHGPRFLMGMDSLRLDESHDLRFLLDEVPDAPVPMVPEEQPLLLELRQGRFLEGAVMPLSESLGPISARAKARWALPPDEPHRFHGDLFVDRRIPWTTATNLARLLSDADYEVRPVVRGPEGPQRLPFLQMMPGVRLCLPPFRFTPASATPVVEERLSDRAAQSEGLGGQATEPCDSRHGFIVTIRDDGHSIADHRSFVVNADCTTLRVGAIEAESPPTIPKVDGAYNYGGVLACARTLRRESRYDDSAALRVRGEGATVQNYVDTFRALRGTEDEPIFRHIN